MNTSNTLIISVLALECAALAQRPTHTFEDLGRPLNPKPLPISVVTRDRAGRQLAWGEVTSPERKGLVGVDIETGAATWIDLARYDYGRINLPRADNGHLYLYTGRPGRFLKLDVNTGDLHDLGVPAQPASYTMGGAVGPDGVFYVGSYPNTTVVCVDPATDNTASLGAMTEDPRNKYVIDTAVSQDNVVFVAVGLHHAELWAYRRSTAERQQIVPQAISAEHDRMRVWTADDGHVYGRAGDAHFRCYPDRIVAIDEAPQPRPDTAKRMAGDFVATSINRDGELILKHRDTGKSSRVPTEFDGIAVLIMGVFCEHSGRIYGGGFQPANVFEFDPASGSMRDLGRHNGGRIQIYDILSHSRGLFISSYGKAVRARTGLIYVQAHSRYVVVDPVERKVVHRGDMPVSTVRKLGIADKPAGPDGLIYGLGDDAVFAFDPADHQARIIARHPSITTAQGVFVTEDTMLYYGSGSRLWRVNLAR